MANIRGYEGPDLGLTPSDRGTSSAAEAASVTGRLYGQAASAEEAAGSFLQETGKRIASTAATIGAQVDQHDTHEEISSRAVAASGTLVNLDAEWNDTFGKADPNDKSVGPKFMETSVEPRLDKLRDGLVTEGGQRFAEQQIEQIRNHFVTKIAADQTRQSHAAVVQNILETNNNLSNAVYRDPTSLKSSIQLYEHAVDAAVASSPNLGGVDRQEISGPIKFDGVTKLVKAAAISDLAKNPGDETLKKYSDDPDLSKYLNAADLKALQSQQRTVQSAQRADESHQRVQQQQEKQDASDQREGQYLVKLHSDDPKEAASVSAKTIASDFTLTREARERMINVVNREAKPETDARQSAQTSVSIIRMMQDPNFDSEKVRAAIIDARSKDPGTPGSLTKADMADLQKNLDDVKTPQGVALAADRNEFFKQYGPTIDPEMKLGNPTPLGAQGLYRAEKDARRQEQALRAKGIDPHALYDPSSQYFLGKPERIGGYRPTAADKAAFEAQLKTDQQRTSKNLTGDGSTVTGVQTLEIPAGMSPADAIKWAKDQGAKPGSRVKLPDGRVGTVP